MKVSLLEYSLGRPWKLTVTFNSAHPEDNQIFCFCWFCLVGWVFCTYFYLSSVHPFKYGLFGICAESMFRFADISDRKT